MIDTILSKVKAGLDGIKDHRMQSGNLQYTLGDTLMSAFAMFHLKDPSLLVFRQRLDERWSNMERVYKIRSVPGDTAMRQALDGVSPAAVSGQFKVVHKVLEELGLWEGRQVLGGYLAISMDGTQHYCSSKKSCEHCLVRQKRNGETDYHHQLLAAVQVHPEQGTVFPLEVEPIQQQDGSSKNDCEQNNKTFNTLKNQGYQLEHNVGHRQRYLSSVLACLVMLAFLTDQVAQHADACFKKALAYCKTRKNLFEKVRQVFDLSPCMSTNVVYRFIAKEITPDFPMLE